MKASWIFFSLKVDKIQYILKQVEVMSEFFPCHILQFSSLIQIDENDEPLGRNEDSNTSIESLSEPVVEVQSKVLR